MAHKEQRDFCIRVKERHPDFFRNKKVLDIGSLDINGSNRDLFENCDYIGIDVGEGKNVDYISVGHLFDGPDNYFDTIISTEVFEHDMFYEKTIRNVMRMLKPGGLFLFTCAAPGRPEHGTRRCGEECAPLLIQISESWADYYKNLEENDIRLIPTFNETFPDGYFELNNIYLEIPADLYFYGIKGGEKYLTNHIIPQYKKEDFNDHIFVIDSWPNNESKEKTLIELIKILKIYNIQILLSGHYPIKPEIQKMVDYYLYDKNNPILVSDEFQEYDVASGRWTDMGDYVIDNYHEYHHDYAIWETMRNSFNFCKYLNKKYIHFFEYDNLPDPVQYRQSFIERIHEFDLIIYEYTEASSRKTNPHLDNYCATFIFSIKTDLAINIIDTIKSKYEYFHGRTGGWQLERLFLKAANQLTNSIHVTDYVANNNELNVHAVWNRDGVDRNGAIFQAYLAVDNEQTLYVHLISGFYEKDADRDYIIEIVYENYKKFQTLHIGEYKTIDVGKYKKGGRVKLYHSGIEVFNEFLGLDVVKFWELNRLRRKGDNKNLTQKPDEVQIHFVDGPYVELKDKTSREFVVEFIDKKTGDFVYGSKLRNGWWTRASILYYVDWRIKITSNDFESYYDMNLNNENVFICFESKSLGDNLAWMPYVEEFRKQKNCKVICSTFYNELFENQYPEIEFVNPGTTVNNIYALYRIGLFYDKKNIDRNRHPSDPKQLPLMKIASDILGLDYVELKPKLPVLSNTKVKRVSIAVHSTAQCKYWNNPTGWQEVVDYLVNLGYEVRLLSREEDGYMGNKNPSGVIQQPSSSIQEILKVIQESELFIGLSSGLSWLAWAANTPTILISGFTDDTLEPKNGVIRVINKNVCNSCWSRFEFDAGDWNWCPEHKGTNRQFECSKTITSKDVINEITKVLV